MRLYGKTARDIWDLLPLSYRIVVAVGGAFICFSSIFLAANALTGVKQALAPAKGAIDIRGTQTPNKIDPSLASDGHSHSLMAYTGITQTNAEGGNTVTIGLASTSFPCNDWRWQQDIFQSRPETLLAPDGVSTLAQGTTRYETPSIVYDPTDSAAPWKIFAYRYFWMGDAAFAQRYSNIVMRTAKDPLGEWSREEWILSTAPDHPPPPYQGLIRGHINPLNPALAHITGYARPSVVVDRSVMLMSLVAFNGPSDVDRVILLASLDHGKRWLYAGTMLTRQDITKIGDFTRISGASLLKQGNAIYLAAVLGDTTSNALGTYLFRLADPAKATLLTASNGVAAPVRTIPRQSAVPTTLGGGYAAFDESCPSGIITSEHSGIRNSYELFTTLVTPAN